jgi:hypothetical protein
VSDIDDDSNNTLRDKRTNVDLDAVPSSLSVIIVFLVLRLRPGGGDDDDTDFSWVLDVLSVVCLHIKIFLSFPREIVSFASARAIVMKTGSWNARSSVSSWVARELRSIYINRCDTKNLTRSTVQQKQNNLPRVTKVTVVEA